jgi:hypothetical protein
MATRTTVLAKLSALLSTPIFYGESIIIKGVRRVTIRVETTGIDLCVETFHGGGVAHSVERLPAGMSYAQIAAHASLVASGASIAPVGALAVHPDEQLRFMS